MSEDDVAAQIGDKLGKRVFGFDLPWAGEQRGFYVPGDDLFGVEPAVQALVKSWGNQKPTRFRVLRCWVGDDGPPFRVDTSAHHPPA